MAEIEIPIYPKANDLVIMIEVIHEVMGGGTPSVLFRIGERMGIRYARDILKTRIKSDIYDPSSMEDKALRNLIGSGWYRNVSIERKERYIDINVKDSFEMESERPSCDFLRGFLVGTYQTFTGNRYIADEKHDPNKKKCVFRLMIMD